MQRFQRVRRAVAAVLLAVYLPACHHWVTPQGMTPQEYITANHPSTVRVTLADSTRVVLQHPRAASDSLWGSLAPGGQWGAPLSSVQLFQVRKSDAAGTVFLTLGIVVGTVFVAGAICAAANCIDINIGY